MRGGTERHRNILRLFGKLGGFSRISDLFLFPCISLIKGFANICNCMESEKEHTNRVEWDSLCVS